MGSLLFVYNAENGFANALIDTGRRIFRPEAYPCALCMMTYGPFGMKEDWKKFIKSLPYKVEFLHKNEVPNALKNTGLKFPCLVELDGEKHRVLIDNTTFSNLKDLASLEEAVERVTRV